MKEFVLIKKKKRINKGFKYDIYLYIFLFFDFIVMWVLVVVYRNFWKLLVFEKVFCVILRLLYVDDFMLWIFSMYCFLYCVYIKRSNV